MSRVLVTNSTKETSTKHDKMIQTVTINKVQVLSAVHEFLKATEHLECAVGLENSCDDLMSRAGPKELISLRKFCLTGSWKNVIECIEVFRDSHGYKKYLYEATKQLYLEELAKLKKMDVLKELLERLKELCPSPEDYSTLHSLVKLSTINDSSEYANWSLSSSRLQVYYKIAGWMSRELNLETKSDQNKSVIDTTLIRLLAKGLMYEKCEEICLKRCRNENRTDEPQMIDLCRWMQRQPDSAYQLPPSRCQLAFLTPTPAIPSKTKSKSVEPQTIMVSHDTFTKPKSQIMVPESAPSTSETGINALKSITQHSVTEGVEQVTTEKTEQRSSDKDCVESTPSNIFVEEHRLSEPESTATHTTEESMSGAISGQQARSSILIRESSKTRKIRVYEEFDDNFVQLTPSHRLLPQLTSGRNSSTPKPSSNKRPPSLQTSPVTHTPQRNTEYRGRVENSRTMSMPRRFDFTETSNDDASIEWPTAHFLCQIQDNQAVRSVAFSQTGRVVAIGANSRTLRLCSTEPLLEKKTSDDDLSVFYHHPSYHKGSIYCLAWSGDTLLASGSNDHTIRLLSYDPTNSSSPCKTLGSLNVHSGTVRDLVFMPSGLLVSGGAVDLDVKLSDPETKQVVCSFVGHSEQVLAVDVIEDNLIASSSQDKTIRLWDVRRESPIWTINSAHPVNSLSVCPPRNELVSSHADGSCCIHSLTGGKTRVTVHPHADDCRSVKWNPHRGQWVLSGSYDGTVCLTEPVSAEWQPVCEHKGKVIQVKWHCGGELFATTSADKRVCFWTLS